MKRSNTPTIPLVVALKTTSKQQAELRRIAENEAPVYNTALNNSIRRHHQIEQDPQRRRLIREYREKKNDEKAIENIKTQLREIDKQYGYTMTEIEKSTKQAYKHYGNIGADEQQILSDRAFKAHQEQTKGNGKTKYRKKGDIRTIPGKSANSRVKREGNTIKCGTIGTMEMIVEKDDYYTQDLLALPTKYAILQLKIIDGREYVYAILYQEGTSPEKWKFDDDGIAIARKSYGDKNSIVTIDPSPSCPAISTQECYRLIELASDVGDIQVELARLDRKIERTRRDNNPDNYNDDGTIKKGRHNWKWTKAAKRLLDERRELFRKRSEKTKQSHERLADWVISQGLFVIVEKNNFSAMARKAKKTTVNAENGKTNSKKRFGKSIQKHAPALFLRILKNKVEAAGGTYLEVDAYALKLSQLDHTTGEYRKMSLEQRWKKIGGYWVQRDLYTCFLARHIVFERDGGGSEEYHVDLEACTADFEEFRIKQDEAMHQMMKEGLSETLCAQLRCPAEMVEELGSELVGFR